MSRALLALLFIVFGVFVFLMCFKNTVVYPLLIPIIIIVALWYIVTFLVTKKMVDKARGGEKLLFLRGQYIDSAKNDVIYGALAVSSNELVFYKRRNWNGGIMPIWSAFNTTVESYELEKVDGKHNGIKISIRGEIHPILIISSSIEKEEKAFRTLLGWGDEKEEMINSTEEKAPRPEK